MNGWVGGRKEEEKKRKEKRYVSVMHASHKIPPKRSLTLKESAPKRSLTLKVRPQRKCVVRHNSIVHIVMLRAAVLVKRSLLTTHMREAGVRLQAVRI